jgi:aspartyl aminopeptidase
MQSNALLFAIEPYGSPLLNSWLNRDLGLAGKVVYLDKGGNLREGLIAYSEGAIVIPQLAIHLDRKINEQGLQLNKQDHLIALAGISDDPACAASYLNDLLKSKLVDFDKLIDSDLFLYSLEKSASVGDSQELIAATRLDNLVSVSASLQAILSKKAEKTVMPMIALWNHEEIGSHSVEGAASPFASQVIERVHSHYSKERESYFSLLANSFCLSVDLAHALHPGYMEKHDPHHRPLLGKGVVLKKSAQQRYAGSCSSMAKVIQLCEREGIAMQSYVSRNDIPAGTTIGPIHAASTGIATCDIGIAELSMHSIRELIAAKDYLDLVTLLKAYL